MVKQSSFDELLAFSYSRIYSTDIGTIRCMIPGCSTVRIASKTQDRRGADYVAVLRHGRELAIDAKSRQAGCSIYWRSNEPELALERWSVKPNPLLPKGRVGWTLDTSKNTDLVLFTFDFSDTELAYLLPFQHLRAAFVRFGKRWLDDFGPLAEQCTEGRYRSACLFVPAGIVLNAIRAISVAPAFQAVSE